MATNTNIQIKFTPLSGNKCVYQFIRVGIESIGSPMVMEKETYEYLADHSPEFKELFYKGKLFYMYLSMT